MNSQLLTNIRSTLAIAPVQMAWLFGSYARSEETSSSDIDILVRFLPDAKLSLFDYGGIIHNLEECTGCRIDLVEENMLKSFARQSVERDKILIYER
jgi:predicted nucleotidyltransferase